MRINDKRSSDICLIHAEEWWALPPSWSREPGCGSGRKLAETVRECNFWEGRKLNGTEFPTNTSNWHGEIGTVRANIIQVTPSVHGGVVNEPL